MKNHIKNEIVITPHLKAIQIISTAPVIKEDTDIRIKIQNPIFNLTNTIMDRVYQESIK